MKNGRTYRVRCKSGIFGWRSRLQTRYAYEAEWIEYSLTYGLSERLGYETPEAAWKANPVIEGSMISSDYRKVRD